MRTEYTTTFIEMIPLFYLLFLMENNYSLFQIYMLYRSIIIKNTPKIVDHVKSI